MAHTAQPTVTAEFAPFSGFFRTINNFLLSFAAALAARRLMEEMQNLSDSELTAYGLNRKDLPEYVAKSVGMIGAGR